MGGAREQGDLLGRRALAAQLRRGPARSTPRSASAADTAAIAPACQRSMRASVASRYRPPKAPVSDPLRRYSWRAPRAISANATSMRTCHSHQLSRQFRLRTTAIIASARRTSATAIASTTVPPRTRYWRNERHAAKTYSPTATIPSAVSGPTPSLGGGGPSSGGSLARDTNPHATIRTISPPSMTGRSRRTVLARGPAMALVDAAAKSAARTSPIGVATTNPAFGWSSSTPGVASACSPRNPALARNASEMRISRASR